MKDVLKFYEAYNQNFSELEKKGEFTKNFYSTFLSGETKVSQKYIAENKTFDEEWIRTVESYVPSLNKIVANPKSSLKMEEEIVQIEKARKINSQSIKHLSANTHFIREVRDDMVVPKKILTAFPEIDYGTYENRFIMTLIDRLFVFVRNRYDVIKRNIDQLEMRELMITSKFPFNKTTVEVDLKLTFKDLIQNKEIIAYNKKLLDRIEYLNKVVTSLKASDFMNKMINQKRIYPPIMRTNIITKDVDYRNSYLLWLFLDRYNTLAFKVMIQEKDLTFNQEYLDALNRQILSLYSTVVANQELNKKEYEQLETNKYVKNSIKVIKRRPDEFLLTPDDEMMEDQTLNEYYLNQNKKIFQQSIDYHLNEAKTYETALKRALRETLNISNALYESFFELEEEDDIFKQLITEVDVTKELADSRRKLLISKMIREVKAVDYNDALRRERTFLNEIIKYDGLLLREYEKQKELSILETEDKKRLEADIVQAKLKLEFVREELTRVRDSQDEINEYRKEVNKQIDDYKRELDKKLEQEIKVYEKELDREFELEVAELEVKHQQNLIVTEETLKREIQKLDKWLKEQKALVDLDYRNKLEAEKQLSKNQLQLRLLRKSNEIVEKAKANEANITRLEEINEKYRVDLENYQKSKK